MMTTTSTFFSRLLMWSLLVGFCLPMLSAQAPVLQSRIDTNCMLHVRLVDSTGSVVSAQAPYLLQVNQIQRNSNAAAIWHIDLSDSTQQLLNIQVTDGNGSVYTSALTSTCYNAPPAPILNLINTAVTPTVNCNSCTGSITGNLNNPPNQPYTFQWSDGFTYTDSVFIPRFNLCAGVYNLIISDSLGNYNAYSFDVLCGAFNGITCAPNIRSYLDASGQATITSQNVRTSSAFTVFNEYFIDADNQVSTNYTFDCSDVGYQYITLLTQDSLAVQSDTCHVLVEVIDTFNYCSSSSNLVVIKDSVLNPINCGSCTGYYSFDYLILPAGDTLYANDLTFLWSDTSNVNSPTRFNLCANIPYVLTIVDNNGNQYQKNISLGCPNNNCLDSSGLQPYSYCTQDIFPVCGCDGITYINACVAEYEAGVLSWTQGVCPSAAFTVNVFTFADTSACDSFPQGSGLASIQVVGGVGSVTYNWSTGATTSFVSNLPAGTYSVTVSDANNSIIRLVTIGSLGCVWPGDTDDNGVVNNFDLLPIGLRYGQNGSARASTSIAWQGYQALNWPASGFAPALPNDKHIDADGNGFIDSVDVNAIHVNYSRSYARSTNNSLLGTIPFYVESGVGQAGDSVRANIVLGDSIDPAVGVYAVAFTINYDPRFLENDPVQIDFNNSWLGNSLIHVQQDVRRRGQVEIAVSRTDQLPITGSGPIGAVSFTIKDDLMMGRLSGDSIVSPISINNVILIDERNRIIGTFPKTGNIVLEENLSTSRLASQAGIQIFPNPTQDILHLNSRQATLQRVQVFTATGQLVQSIELNSTQTTSLSTQEWPMGLYLLRLETSEGWYSEKVRVLR